MNQKKKDNSIIRSVVIGNLGHIFLSFITSILMFIGASFQSLSFYNRFKNIVLFLMFAITLGFWFYTGVISTKYDKNNIHKAGIIAAIISILPAAFFTILCKILSTSLGTVNQLTAWNAFYVFGGPTLFWHHPFSFISQLVADNGLEVSGYIIYFIDFLLVGLMVFAGAIFFGKSRRGKIVSRETLGKEKEESLPSI